MLLLPGGAAPVEGFFPGLAEGLIAEPGARVIEYDRAPALAGATTDLHTTIAGLGLGPVVVIGQSLGGAVALLLARDHPDDVAGLVLLDPSPVNDVALSRQITKTMRTVEGLHRVPLLGRAVQPLITATGVNRHLRRATRPDVRAAWELMKEMDVPQLAEAASGLDELAAGFRAEELTRVPAVVVTADRKPDAAIRRAHERLATALAAPIVSWPGADHNVQLTHPDEVLKVSRDVVSRASGGPR